MPFKFKLKKSRQYNVVSKNLFVISVELLDNTTIECTLSSQSIGQECLQNVCQRLGLQQMIYFGLRFLSKRGMFWWVDLERPLKKQLDKYAQESFLYLGVMFFVSDVNLLHDEITRYHYFLQLKKNIISGKLLCSQEQAIILASYSFQAEFGDHDPKRHTIEYLSNFGLLPKNMIAGKENQEAAMEQVISTHIKLQNTSPALAEVYYILEAQQLDGYGQETFFGKDASGSGVNIGVSTTGVIIKYQNDHPTLSFRWQEIIKILHHKKIFGIQCCDIAKPFHFHMEDSHYATYIWRMCVNQHRFYTQHEANRSTIQSSQEDSSQSEQDKLKNAENDIVLGNLNYEDVPSSPSNFQASEESLEELGVYHTDGRYSERVPVTSDARYRSILDNASTANLDTQQNVQISNMHVSSMQSLSSNGSTVPNMLPANSSISQLNESMPSLSAYSQILEPAETKQILLPSYRQTPDYETAVRQKYGINSSSLCDVSPSNIYNQMPMNSVITENHNDISQSYLQSYYENYTNVTQAEQAIHGTTVDPSELIRQYNHAAIHNMLSSPVHTYSTPELTSQSLIPDVPADQMVSNVHLYYQYKPPPPYPCGQRPSSSTPDLTRSVQVGIIDPNLYRNLEGISDLQLQEQTGRMGSEPTIYPMQHASVLPRSCQSFTYGGAASSQTMVQMEHQSNLVSAAHNSKDSFKVIKGTMMPNNSNCQPTTIMRTDTTYSYINQNLIPHHSSQVKEVLVDSTNLILQENTLWELPVGPETTSLNNHNVNLHNTVLQSPEIAGQFENNAIIENIIQSQIKNINYNSVTNMQDVSNVQFSPTHDTQIQQENENCPMEPMLIATMNGLTLSPSDIIPPQIKDERTSRDIRIQRLENRLEEPSFCQEFDDIIKKKLLADYTTAIMPDNLTRNRFKDVFPYEENRVRLTQTKENRTGYINASHISIMVSGSQKSYIAAQGPLPNTVHSFWQMIWEHHVNLIVMLTDVQEEGREKCFPYWPQSDNSNSRMEIGDFEIAKQFSTPSATFVTCSLILSHIPSRIQRSVWHIQYTDWPDHSCPQDLQGFLSFMEEIDAVKRVAIQDQPPGRGRTAPTVVHCSAGVGRSGVVILCDILMFALDHSEVIDIPKVLTELRLQRMLIVQNFVQYRFVYTVLIQYLKNSRLI